MQTKSIPYTFIRGGYFYFSRRVPNDLRKYYSYSRVVQGLRTSSPQKAKVQANVAAAKLEAYWSQMRLAESEVLGMSLVKEIPASNALALPSFRESISSGQVDCLSLSDALKVYLDLKGKGRPKTFRTAAERSCNYLVSLCGNKSLHKYTRNDALQFRDWLVARGLTGSSVTRNFSYLKAVINFALSEYALDMRNPFVGVYHDRNAGVLVRKPIPLDAIRVVQSECLAINDDMRWLIALISDTGMRLAEGAGLLKQDIVGLETTQPYINLIKHPWRNLKTASSERKIPLVGSALWAAKRIVESDNANTTPFRFLQ